MLMAEVIRKVDKAKWGKAHWNLFISLSLGYFMWGIVTSIAPLSYSLVKGNVIYLALPALFPLIGTLLLPYFSDVRMGRKTTFFITLSLYIAGAIIVSLVAYYVKPSSFVYIPLILLGLLLAYVGVEGEVPTGLSYIAENFPLKWRERMLVLIPNFDNIGITVAAQISIIAYTFTQSTVFVLLSLGIFAIIVGVVILLIRLSMPESIRWLIAHNKTEEVRKNIRILVKDEEKIKEEKITSTIPLSLRYVFLVLIGVSQYLTFGLMAYIVADYYFPQNVIPVIIFVAGLATSLAGLLATYLVSFVRTRVFTLISYLGGTVTMIPILLLVIFVNKVYGVYLILFYLLLSLNMLFSEFGWAVRTILEPLLFPTERRAFLIGLVRAVPIISYSISTYLTSAFTLEETIIYNLILWGIGGFASVWWFFKGYDTNNVPVEYTASDKSLLNQT